MRHASGDFPPGGVPLSLQQRRNVIEHDDADIRFSGFAGHRAARADEHPAAATALHADLLAPVLVLSLQIGLDPGHESCKNRIVREQLIEPLAHRGGEFDFFVLNRIRSDEWAGMHEIRPHIAFRGFWDDEGFWETGFTHVDVHWEWRNGIEIHTGVNFLHEGVKDPFEINEGTFVLAGEYDDVESQLVFQTDQGKPVSFDVQWKHGGFFGGDRDAVELEMNFRMGERFSSSLDWNYNKLDLPVANGDFEVNVGRLRLSYSFSPKVLLQALVQYDDRTDLVATNVRFSWLQSANAGLYLVYNEVDDDSIARGMEKKREFVLKYSRIIDLL